MNADEAAREFADLFPALYRRYYRRIPPTRHRLTSESIAVLRHLDETGPLTVTEAAAHFERSQSATSDMIARLEARGMLARIDDRRDRRRRLIWLTELGQAELTAASQVLSPELLAEAFRRLDPNERVEVIDATRLLVDAATRTNPPSREEPT